MKNIFLLLALFFTPLWASPCNDESQIIEKLEMIFGQDLATDLEEAGLDLEEASEIVKLMLRVQDSDVPVANNDIPRLPVMDAELPAEWECFFETESHRPLVICPKDENAISRFRQVAEENQASIVAAIKKHGAIVFSGFGFTIEDFPVVFETATGVPARAYRGSSPREHISGHVYKSTAVAPSHHIGLHQEESSLGFEQMAQFISFYCEVPPQAGTGRTLVGSAKEITQSVKEETPDLWELMQQHLTTWDFYMPDKGFWSKITKYLNPSHSTVTEKFGTTDPEMIQKWCQERGYKCQFVNGGVKIFHLPLPGVVEYEGELIFCNGFHLSVRNAHLCKGAFNLAIADLLLYEQYGVQLPDGTPFTADQADRLARVVATFEDGRDWKAGDLAIYDNVGALHGKTPHKGVRKVYTIMGGNTKKST